MMMILILSRAMSTQMRTGELSSLSIAVVYYRLFEIQAYMKYAIVVTKVLVTV